MIKKMILFLILLSTLNCGSTNSNENNKKINNKIIIGTEILKIPKFRDLDRYSNDKENAFILQIYNNTNVEELDSIFNEQFKDNKDLLEDYIFIEEIGLKLRAFLLSLYVDFEIVDFRRVYQKIFEKRLNLSNFANDTSKLILFKNRKNDFQKNIFLNSLMRLEEQLLQVYLANLPDKNSYFDMLDDDFIKKDLIKIMKTNLEILYKFIDNNRVQNHISVIYGELEKSIDNLNHRYFSELLRTYVNILEIKNNIPLLKENIMALISYAVDKKILIPEGYSDLDQTDNLNDLGVKILYNLLDNCFKHFDESKKDEERISIEKFFEGLKSDNWSSLWNGYVMQNLDYFE
jgi:hypothetical protein